MPRGQQIRGPIVAKGLLARATALALCLAAGCEFSTPLPDRAARATAAPCPIFVDAPLSTSRPAVACPLSPDAPRPCAVEHYLAGADTPRLVRRLAYDDAGRVRRWSDHIDGRVVAARYLDHQPEGELLVRHEYAEHCADPSPVFLATRRYRFDDAGALVAFAAPGVKARLQYTEANAGGLWLSVSGTGLPGGRYALDPHGHVTAWADAEGAPHTLARITHRAGRAVRVRRGGPDGLYRGATEYSHDAEGRLQAIDVHSPGRPRQRYLLRYDCAEPPTCAPGSALQLPAAARTVDRLRWDPALAHLLPTDCSDHRRYGAAHCARMPAGKHGLESLCCKGSGEVLRVRVLSPLARRGVATLRLVDGDGGTIESTFCTEGEAGAPPHCGFSQAELRAAAGVGRYEALDDGGQIIHRGPVDLDHLARIAR